MRHWNKARTVNDLGNLMADWLEGRIPKRPGYYGSVTDAETSSILPILVRACRAGFVTDNSQPGEDKPAFDGRRWVQRAAVDGWVGSPDLYQRLVSGARRMGLIVADGRPVICTEWDGQPHTSFGGRLSGRDLRTTWDGVSREAFAAIQQAPRLTIIDPQWGPSDRLWNLLRQVA